MTSGFVGWELFKNARAACMDYCRNKNVAIPLYLQEIQNNMIVCFSMSNY